MSIHLYSSNRLEILARQCGEIFRRDPLPPLEAEIVVVQSRGMSRWLAMELAGQLSVWANGYFPFPNTFVEDIFRGLLSESDRPVYERTRAVWQLMELLDELRGDPLFLPLASYLGDPLKRFQLAEQLAGLFDQYIIYRPDFIGDWEQGRFAVGGWQGRLWHEFAVRHGRLHRGALLEHFFQVLRQGPRGNLPRRVTFFGISSLPPFHLDVLHALSEYVSVNFFLMNPCQQWWGDIMPEREISRRALRARQEAGALYLESGHPLLASMGHLARDFLILLQERDCREHDLFEAPEETSLLSAMQKDILELTYGGHDAAADSSVVVNSCHSPMREVEVLQDHLLALFDSDKSLTASDVIVMAPDIEVYSALVQAVFDLDRAHPHFIPFTLADRSAGADSELIDAFLTVLDMAAGRCAAGEIAGFTARPLFLRKFSLSEADLGVMEEWVEKLAIRWGRDARQKEKLGLPPYGENTWRAGFDRLLLGYAMADRQELFASILPFGALAESDAGLLGRMLDAFTVLFHWLERLPGKRGLAEWAVELQGLLAACFPADQEQEGEMPALRQALLSLSDIQQETGFHEEIDLRVIKNWLHRLLRVEKSPRGFLSGGVTFCSLLPMRAIPFKVVCLLGMNDGDFPRPRFDLSFDLMGREPRRGDRSSRLDDRYLFLEALLSARNQLYISYVGQSARDDATLPPSVLVSELVDCLADMCQDPDGTGRQGSDFVTCQRLQPFHPAYFQTGSAFFSYSAENLAAAKRLLSGGDPDAGFWTSLPLQPQENMAREIDLDDFINFFLHPLRFFCRNRLGFELSGADEAPADAEPFSLTGLPLYQLETELLSRLASKEETQSLGLLWRARGALPHGRAGDIAVREVRENVAGFYKRLAKFLAPPVEPPVFRIAMGDFVLRGRLEKMTENGLLHGRPARMKGKDLLRAWIMHLVFNRLSPDGPCRSAVVARDRSVVLQPVFNSHELLEQLMVLFLQGQREPLPFFVETSFHYAVYAREGRMEKAGKEAQASWRGRNNGRGERDDEYIRFRFQNDQEPLGEAFADLAVKIFAPLFTHMEDDNG